MQEFTYADGTLTRARTFALPAMTGDTLRRRSLRSAATAARCMSRACSRMTLSAIDFASGQVLKTVPLPAEPYTCVLSADGQFRLRLAVGRRARPGVLAARLADADRRTSARASIPNAMVLSHDGKRLFVACGNSAAVWVFNTFSWRGDRADLDRTCIPDAPPTSTPNSLALSPDGRTLLIANADNNAVAVVDV